MGILLIVIAVVFFNQLKKETYGHVLKKRIADQEVTAIYIRHFDGHRQEKEMLLENESDIKALTEDLFEMTLKKTNDYHNTHYFLIFEMSDTNFTLTVDGHDHLYIDGENYKVTDEHKLAEVIESFDHKWEEREE